VARRSGPYPTATGSRTRRRHAPALGEASSSFTTEPGEGSQGISSTACTDQHASASTEIPQTRSRASQGHPETTKNSLSRHQESSVTECGGFNRKLRSAATAEISNWGINKCPMISNYFASTSLVESPPPPSTTLRST
jgi:hypothetical protein